MSLKRKTYSNSFKAKVALAAIRGDMTIAQLVKQYGVSASMIHLWKKYVIDNAASSFPTLGPKSSSNCNCGISEKEAEKLYAKIGKLEIEKEFLAKKF